MTALKNVYERLIQRANGDEAKLNDLKEKIGVSFAVGLLIKEEQAELMVLFPKNEIV